MIARNPRLQRLVAGGMIERFYLNVVSRVQLMGLGIHKDRKVIDLIRRTRKQRRSLLSAHESFTVYSWARALGAMPGDMAEVGVYEGCSAKLICEAKGDRALRLFDTFEGLPSGSGRDRAVYSGGQYRGSLESAQHYLQQYPNVHFYKGYFPQTTSQLNGQAYSFVHLDVDLYESTLACLNYFYPRMQRGGVMLSHDYSILAGVRGAFDEFLADKPESLIELPSTQCMVIKL